MTEDARMFNVVVSRKEHHDCEPNRSQVPGSEGIRAALLVARAALRINTDGRPLPTKKRWQTCCKLCAPHLLTASCAPSREWP